MSMATEPRKGQNKFSVIDADGGGGSVDGGTINHSFEIDMDNNLNSHNQYPLEEFSSSKRNGATKSRLRDISGPVKKKSGVFASIGLLLWKNTLLRRRHWIITLLEIILPTLFACLIAFFKTWTPPTPPVETNIITNSTQFFERDLVKEISRWRDRRRNATYVLGYAPANNYTDEIMRIFQDSLKKYKIPLRHETRGFESEEAIKTFNALQGLNLQENQTLETLRAAIIFEKGFEEEQYWSDKRAKNLAYKIRMVDKDYKTDQTYASVKFPGPDTKNAGKGYQEGDFASIQIFLDKAITSVITNQTLNYTVSVQGFPYPPYKVELDFSRIFINLLPQFLVFGFVFIVPSILRNVVAEKESGIKELMKMMGLKIYLHWIGWMLDSVLILIIPVTIVVVVLFKEFNPETGAFLAKSDPTIWWVVILLYVISAVSCLFFISTFFQKATLAIAVGVVSWIILYFIVLFPLEANYEWLSLSQKMLSCLLPNMALHWSVKLMYSFEAKGIGAQWSKLGEPLNTLDDFTIAHVIIMLIISSILYMLLTMYFECIIPSKYGIRRPWYFIFKPSFWKSLTGDYGALPLELTQSNGSRNLPEGFEMEPNGLNARVEIQNLRKVFGGKHVAVDGLSLNMFEGQITVLLGCNGAGKTTLISMLTGLYNPTGGSAKINGYNIRKDMDTIRTQLGYCSQYNILFEQLTVRENLQFCGRLKGMNSKDVNLEIKELLVKLQLSEKKTALAANLSGGQKRKLSLGMALVGGSRVVIMDEPTAGMDPEARRGIWDLLLEVRENRTMLLTTHFMEEADILGDRVAIMSTGKIHCCGSTLFLKKHYGSGYTLKMSVYAPPKSNCDAIFDLVKKYAPEAFWQYKISEINQNDICDVSIVLPRQNGVNDTTQFPAMFAELSREKDNLGILDIGLPLTTLDDVFAKVVEETEEKKMKNGRNGLTNVKFHPDQLLESRGANYKVTGLSLVKQHIVGLLMKRILYTLRNKILFAAQLLLPFLLVLAAVQLFNELNSPLPPSPVLRIDLAPYKNPKSLYAATNDTLELGDLYSKYILGYPLQIDAEVDKVEEGTDLDTALLNFGRKDELQYRERYVAAADFKENHVRAMFQTLPIHASPLAINLASNAMLRYMDPDMDDKEQLSLSVTNHPMKSGLNSLLESCTQNPRAGSNLPLIYALLIPLGLSTLAAGFIVFPLEERICRAKQLQIMTGMNIFIFWMSSFLWDLMLVVILAAAMIAFFPIMETFDAFTTANAAPSFFLIIVVYGIAAISFSYLFSLCMTTVAGGFAFITVLHLVTGTLLSIVVHGLEQSNFFELADNFRWGGRLFPTFGASMSMIRFVDKVAKNVKCNMVTDEVKNIICNPNITDFDSKVFVEEFQACCDNCEDFANKGVTCFVKNDFLVWQSSGESEHIPASVELPGIGQELLALMIMSAIYLSLLFLFEYLKSRKGLSFGGNEKNPDFPSEAVVDSDVQDENKRIDNMIAHGEVHKDAIVVENLCKRFGTFAAVSNMNFGVHRGECYGLLGVNGAGKTTLFQMMTGNLDPTSGNVHICCRTLKSDNKLYMKQIGYCPQYDGLIKCLSGREMLELFCRLRGIHPNYIKAEAGKWLERYGLAGSANVQCGNYSGGMKRRLSAAIAMVGHPKVILLDEPTSGVDSVSRRQFWDLVKAGKDAGQALILTSHSMKECEALCSRLSIMVNGQLKCTGTVQHLKSKLSQGFAITIKISQQISPAEREHQVKPLCEEINNAFTPCILKEQHENVIEYQVMNTGIDWEAVFRALEDLKQKYVGLMEDYSVSETTLEEIFLSVAKTKSSKRQAKVSLLGRGLATIGL